MNLGGELQNANPVVVQSSVERRRFFSPGSAAGTSDPYLSAAAGSEELDAEPFDALEVYDLIRDINDPEHPLTLEQLSVAQLDLVRVDDERNEVMVHFTPTIPHCSMATLIGLCIRVKLLRSLPRRFKVTVLITPGTHASEEAVNKQLNDKERIAAATENKNLLQVINKCLSGQEAF